MSKQKHMANTIVGMPSDDELFTAFTSALQEGTPESKRAILKTFESFLEKAKWHLKNIVALNNSGLEFNLTKETGDKMLSWFISSQNFLLKLPLKAALMIYGADSFTHFVQSTKEGKNNPETTVNGLVHIATLCMKKLWVKYAIVDTDETITNKVKAVFDIENNATA